MRLLIITFYYPPDLSAGSFRIKELVTAFQNHNIDLRIDVITTQPNRYYEMRHDYKNIENFKNLKIHRVEVPKHKNTMFSQIFTFAHFAFKVLKYTKEKKWDYIFCTSSRLMTAYLGALISNRNKTPLFIDIRDIFSDTIRSYYRNLFIKLLLPIIFYIEKYTLKTAIKVYLVSPAFLNYFKKNHYLFKYKVVTNGIDEEFLRYNFKNNKKKNSKKIILYAGNIGDGQGLEKVIPYIAENLNDNYIFWIVGSGGKVLFLKKKVNELNLKNVKFFSPMSRSDLMKIYKKVDILFLHLNNYSSNKKVLPSKIFEYGAIGKPIIAGVLGESFKFMKKEIPSSFLFKPYDYTGILKKINANEIISINSNQEFEKKFDRKKIMKEFVYDLLREFKNLK